MGSLPVRLACSGLAISGVSLLAVLPAPAHAQLGDRTIVSIMRECRRIADDAARTACFDNIPLGDVASPGASAAPPPAPVPAPVAAPPAAAPSQASPTTGLGAEQVRTAPPPSTAAAPDRVTASVTSAEQREPGIYLLTLSDGAQWQFVDAVPISYAPPRAGSQVEIRSGALGSYQLRFNDQRPVRVRRIR